MTAETQSSPDAAPLTAGDPCPAFALPEADGGTVSYDSLRGAPFVLYFYPKADTPGCTTEAIEFTALIDAFAAAGTAVFGVSPDPVAAHCRFRDKHALRVRLLSDETHSLLEAFGVWREKSMYGRTYMGVERSTALVGVDGTIVRVWPKVKVAGHAAEVLAAAQALRHAA